MKKLITTCYKNQDADLFSNHESEKAIFLEYNGDKNVEELYARIVILNKKV